MELVRRTVLVVGGKSADGCLLLLVGGSGTGVELLPSEGNLSVGYLCANPAGETQKITAKINA
jgi:hypothetical protein